MRFEIVKAIFVKELRETLRDRRSLIMMFGIPLLLYPLLALSIAKLGSSRVKEAETRKYTIAVMNAEAAPQLLKMLQADGKSWHYVQVANPVAALMSREIDGLLVISKDLEQRALKDEPVTIRIDLDRSRTESMIIERKAQHLVREYEKWIIRQRLGRLNVPDTVLRPIQTDTNDISTGSQRLGRFLAGMLPILLLVTGMLGAFFPALNATTTERETGTLETLLVTPARKVELLIGKGALVLVSSFLTAALNLVSMSLVMWRILSTMVSANLGEMTLSPSALILTYLAAMPTLIFFTAMVMIVGLFARSFREANSYATPVMLLPMLAMIVSIGEPDTTTRLLLTPIMNTAIIIRDVLTGRVTAGSFMLAFCSSCFYAALMLSAAARIFTSERLVNPTWEPLSLWGLRRSSAARRRFPAIDEALVLFAAVLLLLFYISPSFARFGLVPTLAGNELLLITAPTLLLAVLARYRWRDVFSFRPAPILSWISAALIGLGLALSIDLLIYLQTKIWKPDLTTSAEQLKLFVTPLLRHPVLIVILVGLLAGVCEELLFRGPIQSALARKLPMWPTLLIGSLLFGAMHMDLYGLPARTLISLFLAWIVYRGGSIYPAMLMHAVYDSTKLAFLAWEIRGQTYEQMLKLAAETTPTLTHAFYLRTVLGAGMLIIGCVLIGQTIARSATTSVPSSPEAISV